LSSLLDPYIPLLYYLGIWAVILALGYLLKAEKHGILLKPYYFMLKTVAFNAWMERIGSRFRRFWLTFYDIGAAMGLGLLALALFSLAANLVQLAFRTRQAGPTVLIVPIPGLTIGWDIFPYILIAIAILLIPHEAAHGIASVLDRVPIKSSGVFMAVFLPGGFVEIDEEDLAKRKARTKLRVFSAGSFTNVVTWSLVLLLLAGLFQSAPSGVLVTSLVNGGGAQTAGVPQWAVITQLNSTAINSAQDLANYLSQRTPGNHVLVHLNDGEEKLVTLKPDATNSSIARIGISSANYYALRVRFLQPQSSFYLFNVFYWNLLILLNVGIVNMLPLYPFDGDRYFDTVLRAVGLKNTKPVRITAGLIALGLLVSNLVLSFFLFGTVFLR
jgi:membrane-associated protease RseP (regulator of RpoE activity)